MALNKITKENEKCFEKNKKLNSQLDKKNQELKTSQDKVKDLNNIIF